MFKLIALIATTGLGLGLIAGCTGDTLVDPVDRPGAALTAAPSPAAPAGLVTVPLGADAVTFWPYTGNGFDGAPVDPVNVVIAGEADPVDVRAALLALDGDRTAFGFPPAYPFNATWEEAFGDVQTTYVEGAGWTASVIQLQLGSYDPVRFHLRLFSAVSAAGAPVTLGGAHFEVLIPNTTEHQVLSWELAQQIVAVDLIRTGLLGAAPGVTPVINQAPSYREIPAVIYNGLPPDLQALTGGPIGPVTDPVPLANDGSATVIVLAGTAPPAPGLFQTVTIPFDQVIPRPFCSDGPHDWVHVGGTVDFVRESAVDAEGRYEYDARFEGRLVVTPVDITVSPPVPVGESTNALVRGHQTGFTRGDAFRVMLQDQRLALPGDQSEMLHTVLRVASEGRNDYRVSARCIP